MRYLVSIALLSGLFSLQPLKAETSPCVGADGKPLASPKNCPKAPSPEKQGGPMSAQKYKATLKANAEQPSDQDEPTERENRHAPEATQAPNRQQDLDSQMFKR